MGRKPLNEKEQEWLRASRMSLASKANSSWTYGGVIGIYCPKCTVYTVGRVALYGAGMLDIVCVTCWASGMGGYVRLINLTEKQIESVRVAGYEEPYAGT